MKFPQWLYQKMYTNYTQKWHGTSIVQNFIQNDISITVL